MKNEYRSSFLFKEDSVVLNAKAVLETRKKAKYATPEF